MITAWTKHCKSVDEKEKYTESLKRAQWVLEDIKTLINENLASLEASEMSPKGYDSPNWAYRQAHVNGYKQALRDFTKLLTLDQKD